MNDVISLKNNRVYYKSEKKNCCFGVFFQSRKLSKNYVSSKFQAAEYYASCG